MENLCVKVIIFLEGDSSLATRLEMMGVEHFMTDLVDQVYLRSAGDIDRLVSMKLASVDWDFPEANVRGTIHDIHPYPARFIPQIPRELIRLFPPDENLAILDPFCGCGTTLVEAVSRGYPAIGIDVNPLAILIAKVKTTPLQSSLVSVARSVVKRARTGKVVIPDIPRLDHWFLPSVQEALARLVREIDYVDDVDLRDALKVALSRIIVRVSNQESDTRYAAVFKDVSAEDVYELFLKSAGFIEEALDGMYGGLFSSTPKCMLLQQDILSVTAKDIPLPVGLVVTSPPYPNAYEYWLYHKYRMYWLGMDPIAVRSKEIGARPHYFKANYQTEMHFEAQMGQVFKLLSQVMKKGAFACFVVGPSRIHGREVDNAIILERAACIHGFRKVGSVYRNIPRTRKAFNPAHARINREQIIVFVLEGEIA